MPVYDRGYTHWEPSGRAASPAWWVIARRGIVSGLKHKAVFGLVLLALVPAIVKGGIIYATLKAGDLAKLLSGGWTSIDPEGFLRFLEMQRFPVFAILALVGAGLIAQDRQDNGLSLYFSRPLGLRDYLLGKVLILVFFYWLVTLLPALLLCVYAYWVAPEASSLDLLLLTPLRLVVYCGATGLSMGLVLLAFSSLGKRPIFVMVWWTIRSWAPRPSAASRASSSRTPSRRRTSWASTTTPARCCSARARAWACRSWRACCWWRRGRPGPSSCCAAASAR